MALPPTNPPGLVRDAEDLNKVVNGEGTTNRAGDSLPSIKAVFERINDDFDAMQAGELTAQAVDAADRAETAAEQAAAAGLVYESSAAGQADVELDDGDYFFVVSADSDEVLELWRKGASSPTDTGKRTIGKPYVDAVEDQIIELENIQGVVGRTSSGSGAFNSSGGVVSDSNYKRTASNTDNLFRCDPESAEYYYSGEIADAGYVGVIYKDESNNVLGFECDSVQAYSRYKLTPLKGTYWIAACSLSTAKLLIEKKDIINAGKRALEVFSSLSDSLADTDFTEATLPLVSGGAIAKEWIGLPNSILIDATGYQRTSISNPSNLVSIQAEKDYFYSGQIDRSDVAGVTYISADLLPIAQDCTEVGTYDRYPLNIPEDAEYIAACSLESNPLKIEFREQGFDHIQEKLDMVTEHEVDIQQLKSVDDFFMSSFVSRVIGSITTAVGALWIVNGGPVSGATEYRRTSSSSTASMFNIADEEARHYYTGEIDNTDYAGVVYFDENLSMLGFECNDTQVYDNYPLTLPEGAAYIATCSKGAEPIISYDVVSTGDSRAIYVDANYSGGDSDGSIAKPFTTISSAINDASGSQTTFVIAGGDYRETLPLSTLRNGLHQFIGKQTETVRILGSDKLTDWTLSSGNVYQVEYSGTIPDFPRLGGRLLFEDGNPSKEITDNPHPLQRNLSYRLPFTPIYPRNSIAEVEAEPGTYYYDGSTIYLHPNGSGNPNSNGFSYEVIVRSPNTVSNINTQTEVIDIFMQNIQFMFMVGGVLFRGFNTVKRLNCTAMASNGAGAWRNDTGYIETWFEEAAFCNGDGENCHFSAYSGFNTDTDNRVNYPNVIHNYLWSHDNGDDGESSHENHNVVMIGSLLEWNGDSGSRPSNDATYNYSHCHARKNGWEVSNYWQSTSFTGGEGFAVVNPAINPNRVGCRAYLDNCISEENCVGYGTISQDENYIEVVNSISRNNTIAEFYAGRGKIVSRNNRATNADPAKLKVETDGVIEVINDDLLV